MPYARPHGRTIDYKRKTMTKTLLFCLLLSLATTISAQIGGYHSFEYLSLPQTARETALGGGLIAVSDGDLGLGIANPALLDARTSGSIQMSWNGLFAGVNTGSISYGHHLDKLDISLHGGINFVRFGEFVQADQYGNKTGTFSGSEAAVFIGASKSLADKVSVGVNIKGITGSIESYSAFGLAADLGILYKVPENNFNIALVVKNIGSMLDNYGSVQKTTPIDVQIGISKRLKYIPFRYSITARNLQRWDISYDDPAVQKDIFGKAIVRKEVGFFENAARHIIISGEFLLGKSENFRIRFGYNHLRKRELSLSEFRSLAGFSFGAGISIKGFKLDYGLGYHHVAGGNNHLTLRTDLSRFY